MTVTAVTVVRDEADIIETTLRHTATQVDHIIAADNGSADGTRWQAGRATDSDFAWRTSLARSDGHWVAAGQRLGPIHPPGT